MPRTVDTGSRMVEKWERLVLALERADGWVTAATLADALDVTTRTVRTYASQANAAVEHGDVDVRMVESGPEGYRLNRGARTSRLVDVGAVTPAARLAKLLRALIDADEGVDVNETAAAAHVSESTLESDLTRARARLDGTGLRLVRVGSGVRLEGPESARRRLLGTLLREESARGMIELDVLRREFPEVPAFHAALLQRLDELGYTVNEYALDDVLLHVAIAVDRTSRARGASEASEWEAERVDGVDARPDLERPVNDEPRAATSAALEGVIAELVTAAFGRSLPRSDLDHLARLLTTRAATPAADASEGMVPASARAEVVRDIVRRATAEYLVELADDDFIDRLALHVDNLAARAATEDFSRNPLTASIKSGYPLIYDLAVYVASELGRLEGIRVNDDEIAYLAMHVGAHLDRRSRGERVRLVVAAPAYHDVRTALADRVRAALDDDVDVVESGPTDSAALGAADLVVAIIPPVDLVVRLVLVPPFAGDGDLEKIRTEVAAIRRARRRAALGATLARTIGPDLFVRGMRGLDRERVIRMLGARMIASGVIDEAYLEGALERERLSSTAFTDGLAVPHAMTMTAKRTAIAVAVDDVPIDWDGVRVHVVAFIAFAESGRSEFQNVFDQFVEAFAERENVLRLVRGASDHAGLLAELARIMAP